MSEYIGTIEYFTASYAPWGWLPCNGSLVSIRAYTALYAFISTKYGGDGTKSFALPNIPDPFGPPSTAPMRPIGYCICALGDIPTKNGVLEG